MLLMSLSSAGCALFATAVLAGASSLALSPAQADGGRIQFIVLKAGVVIGGSGGSGSLIFKGLPSHRTIAGTTLDKRSTSPRASRTSPHPRPSTRPLL